MKTGDLILFSGNDFPSIITKIGNVIGKILNINPSVKYTHCGVMISDIEIVEALNSGVKMRVFPYTSGYEVYRGKFTEEQISQIKSYALSCVGEKYNWFLIISIAILKILHLEWLFKGISHKGQICSVLVGRCYEKAGYLFNNETIDVLDPSDIGENILKNKNFWSRQ